MDVRNKLKTQIKRLYTTAVKPKLSTDKLTVGQAGEATACTYLQEQGLTLVEKNYHCPMGEIDLVMMHKDMWVFVEVRRRKSNRYGSPLETVTKAKQRKIQLAASHYLLKRKISGHAAIRFDVVGITDQQAQPIEWVPHAFESMSY